MNASVIMYNSLDDKLRPGKEFNQMLFRTAKLITALYLQHPKMFAGYIEARLSMQSNLRRATKRNCDAYCHAAGD